MHAKIRRNWAQVVGMAFLAVGATSSAYAEDGGDRVEIHGYGHQGYLQAKDNIYLKADDKGSWDYNALALLFAAKIDDKSKVWMQLYGDSSNMRLDWAFVDYQLTSTLTGRAGQIKAPIGLYNEIRDIKFLQLSTLQPMLYQEAVDIAFESYRGVAVAYDHDLGNSSLALDAYAGQQVDFESSTTIKNRGLTGGRLTYKTPLDGLKFMVSAYTNKKKTISTAVESTLNSAILSADYTANNWDIKAEYADQHNGLENKKARTYYAQAGYTFAEKWTPFMRYDYITTDVSQKSDPSYYQKSKVLGVNYKLNNSVAVRVENHWNTGYAMPVASSENTGVKDDWNLFAASVNFIF